MAMNGSPVISTRFPYVPIRLTLHGHSETLEALLDTGFDGDLVVPGGYVADDATPIDFVPARLADGSEVLMPAYDGAVQIGSLATMPVLVLALGDIPIVGTNVIRRFPVILDHGQRVIVEP